MSRKFHLTDQAIADYIAANGLPQKQKNLSDSTLRGLGVALYPSGEYSAFFRYTHQNTGRKTIQVGRIAGAFGMEKARAEAALLETRVRLLGECPATELAKQRRERKAAQEQARQQDALKLRAFIHGPFKDAYTAYRTSHADTFARLDLYFGDWMEHTLLEITPAMVAKRQAKLARTKKQKGTGLLSPSYVNKIVNALSAVYTFATDTGAIPEDAHPIRKLKQLKEAESNPRALTAHEEARLRAALDRRESKMREARLNTLSHRGNTARKAHLEPIPAEDFCDYMKPAVILSLKTGLRQSELFSLQWRWINFDTGKIEAHASITKSRKTRTIPISQEARQVLEKWKCQNDRQFISPYVFPSIRMHQRGRHSPMSGYTRNQWLELLKDAGLGPDEAGNTQLKWHNLRHDFGSKLVQRGANILTVKELMGHAKLETTLRYLKTAEGADTEAVALLDEAPPAPTDKVVQWQFGKR